MQTNRNGTINLLMLRNLTAEYHRGSTLLERIGNKRPRLNSSVLNKVDAGNGFKKFYLEGEDAWVSCGDAVIFGADEFQPSSLQVGKVQVIDLDPDGNVRLSLRLFAESPAVQQRPLDGVATRMKELAGPNDSIIIVPHKQNLYVGTYSVQPDFSSPDHVYSCPFMTILS
jgi:hypothetical protein